MFSKRLFVLPFMFLLLTKSFAQVSEYWVLDNLETYSPSSYYIIKQYKTNGTSISHGGSSTSSSMNHLEFCDLTSIEKFLSTIATTVHETTHAFDSQIPYMLARQGSFNLEFGEHEGFVFDEHTKIAYSLPKQNFFPSIKLANSITGNLRTFRYDTYIESKLANQSTQSEGIIGLMEEFNAYYHGSKVIFDLLPIYKEQYGDNFLWSWSSEFTSNADAYYEFDFFIKEYLLYAKANYPLLYEELKNDYNFKLIYKNIRSNFSNLINQYEKKYNEFTLSAKKGSGIVYSSSIHSNLIYPILAEHIKSSRYLEINSFFLSK